MSNQEKLYHTIGEVSEMLGEAPSTLRFWETAFPQIKPTKNRRGSRIYTAGDIELLRRVQHLTRDCGYTLEGAREQLRQHHPDDPRTTLVADLTRLRTFLTDLKASL